MIAPVAVHAHETTVLEDGSMNAPAGRGSIGSLAWFLIFAAVDFGVMTAPELETTPTFTTGSMNKRKAIQKENKDHDGKLACVEYHNSAGPVLRTWCPDFSDGSGGTVTTTYPHTPTPGRVRKDNVEANGPNT